MTSADEEAAMLLRLADQDRMAFLTLCANPEIEMRVIGFHAQQAVEKFLKAVLVARGKVFAPTHDLARLAQALATTGVALPVAIDALKRLNPYAVAFRYDDRDIHTVTRDDTSALVGTCAISCSSARATQRSHAHPGPPNGFLDRAGFERVVSKGAGCVRRSGQQRLPENFPAITATPSTACGVPGARPWPHAAHSGPAHRALPRPHRVLIRRPDGSVKTSLQGFCGRRAECR